jgi:hypothetical protein
MNPGLESGDSLTYGNASRTHILFPYLKTGLWACIQMEIVNAWVDFHNPGRLPLG